MFMLLDIIMAFPDIPPCLFKFSKEGLTQREKFYEIKKYTRFIIGCKSYSTNDQVLALFVYNLYKNEIISFEEYFNEVFIYENAKHSLCNAVTFMTSFKNNQFRFNNTIDKYSLVYDFAKLYADKYITLESIDRTKLRNSNADSRLLEILDFANPRYESNTSSEFISSIEKIISYIMRMTTYKDAVDSMIIANPALKDDTEFCGEEDISHSDFYYLVSPIMDEFGNSDYLVQLLRFLDLKDFETIYHYNDAYVTTESSSVEKNFVTIVNKVKKERGII